MTTLFALLFLQDQPTYPDAAASAAAGPIMIVWLIVVVLMIAAMWKVFAKAGKPGWAAIIPIYNFIVLLEIARRPLWWIVLMLIPFVNFIIIIIVSIDIAKHFRKGTGFGLGLAFLPFIFYPILAWGDAQYQPQAA
jgi:hypothetical protein